MNGFIGEDRRGGNSTHTEECALHYTCDLQPNRNGKYLFVSLKKFLNRSIKMKGCNTLCIAIAQSLCRNQYVI